MMTNLIFILSRRAHFFVTLALLWIGGMGSVVQAESYPSRPIQLVVPFSAGGPVDATARLIGQKLSEALGQPVVVNNRPGGDTIIAADWVARSSGDGHTLLLTSNQHSINPALRQLSYDPDKDFVPITMVAVTPILLVAHPSLPANSVPELIDLLKANPDKYFYSSAGAGSSQHLTAELFKAATGTQITHVPFKGTAPSTVALLSGDVQLSFATPTTTIPHVETGKLKVLATTTAERSVQVPNV
ncbi:MAG: Bug family tripartite tricarboxylate transporter substrate binding protein, partial [Pigmentiphaga sp.]